MDIETSKNGPTPELQPLAASARDRALHTDHLLHDLGRRSVRGGMIMIGAQALKVLAQFGSVIVLTRLLAPQVFGLIAMVAALNTILDLVKELGLSAPTIQNTRITHAQVNALFWINAAAGLLVTVALFLAAPGIAAFYHQPALIEITRWLSLTFLVNGLTTQHWALLRRQMRFNIVAPLETGAEITSFAVAIAMAVAGAGYWSLVAQRLVSSSLVFIGSWSFCRWRPSWPAPTGGVKELFFFGASVAGSNVVAALARSVDQVLIGWVWGPGALGFYERASKLLLLPINNLNVPLYSVAMPALSRLAEDSGRYRRAYLEMVEKLAMVIMPLAAILAVTSDWVVALLFGAKWAAAAPLVACFGAAAIYQPIVLAVCLNYLPLNRPRELLRATFTDAGITILSFIAGIHWGALGVAASFAGVGLLIRVPVAFWLACRRGPVHVADLVRAVQPSALAALAAAGAVWLLRSFVFSAALPHPVTNLALTLPVALAAAALAFCAMPRSRAALHTIVKFPAALRGTAKQGWQP
ncbi:MAG TPA: lipopolysaccharide biosynthesis protein [Alphaproteobacteria bacterium]|nr:lipopolysaccharide biosynthesis protein [Alphaproteobacteria bacterium]